MMATLTDAAFDDDDWLYEIKWDGYRVEAVVSDGKAQASGRATASMPRPTSRT